MKVSGTTVKVPDDPSRPLSTFMAGALNSVVAPFQARTTAVIDDTGCVVASDVLVVHSQSASSSTSVPLNNVAVVIECHEELTAINLGSSYSRAERLKLANKIAVRADSAAAVDMTTVLIVARKSALSLEQLAAEMVRLNSEYGTGQWPDAVAILETGFLNYTARLPSREEASDFLLPASGLAGKVAPAPFYVSLMARSSAGQTLQKVQSLVLARAQIFEPGSISRDYRDLLTQIPKFGVPQATYQYNLAGKLRPVTSAQVIVPQLNADEFLIESNRDELGQIRFEQWQDGGVILMRGKFPMLPFFMCLKQVVPSIPFSDMQNIEGQESSLSLVLPISRAQFHETLLRFVKVSSNIKVRQSSKRILVQRMSSEGTSSPLLARLMVSVMMMRDSVHAGEDAREKFDELYEPALVGVRELKDLVGDIAKTWEVHHAAVATGRVVRRIGRQVRIDESIDRAIRRSVNEFVVTSVRTIKNCMQALAAHHGIELGFLFKKEPAFRAGIARLSANQVALATYLKHARTWTEPLIGARNRLEHGALGAICARYAIESDPIAVSEPQFEAERVTQFVSRNFERVACFVEEMTAYCLMNQMPNGITITEVPLADRDFELPVRFRTTPAVGGGVPWLIEPHSRTFEEV